MDERDEPQPDEMPIEDDLATEPSDEPRTPTEELLPDDADAADVIGVTSPLWRP